MDSLVCAGVAGLQLVTSLMLLLAGQGEASEMTGSLSILPVLGAVGFLIAEWTKDIPGGDSSGNVDYLNHIINN